MRIPQVTLFFLCFVLELKVKAELIYFPESCQLNSSQKCVLSAKNYSAMRFGKTKLFLENNSILEKSDGQLKLVKGQLSLIAVSAFSIRTPYGTIRLQNNHASLKQLSDSYEITNLSGDDISIQVRSGETLNLPSGFKTWIGGSLSKGVSLHGLPVAIQVTDIGQFARRIFPHHPKRLISTVKKYKSLLTELNLQAADLYTQVSKRNLAIAQKQKEDQEEQKKILRQKQVKLRNLYYDKVFNR